MGEKPLPPAQQTERDRQCLELRRAGLTFDVIAERVGYANRGAAYKAYRRALDQTMPLSTPEARELEFDRLERLHAAVWPKALRGDLKAVDVVLRIAAARMALSGALLDLHVPEGGDVIDDLAARRATRRETTG